LQAGAGRRQSVARPFVVLTFAAGSFGPLLYLVVRELRSTAAGRIRIAGRSYDAAGRIPRGQ
jgi:hypothetical protein